MSATSTPNSAEAGSAQRELALAVVGGAEISGEPLARKQPVRVSAFASIGELVSAVVTGREQFDAAVIVLSVNDAARHGCMLPLVPISQIVAVVKEAHAPQALSEAKSALSQHGLTLHACLPATGATAPSLAEVIAALVPRRPAAELPLRLPIEEISRTAGGQAIVGQIESGTVKVGDTLVFSPQHKTSVVAYIDSAAAAAVAGERIRLTLKDRLSLERGQVASHEADAPIESNRFKGRILMTAGRTLALGDRFCVRIGIQELEADLVMIERVLDLASLEPREAPTRIAPREIAEVTIQTRGALVMDNFDRNPALGRFALVEQGAPFAAGIIYGGHYTDRTQVKSQNIFWSEGNVTARHRALRNRHKGAVLWLTGLSGSGKSTLSRALERELFHMGLHVYVLDGDNVRHGLNANLGFSPEDREENIRRVAEVAKLLSDAGVVVVTAFISPYRADRRRAREIALEAGGEFFEVFVNAPLAVCEQRDAKGLYKRARAGEIKEFTGISAPYEAPADPEVTVHTDLHTREECVAQIIEFLRPRLEVEAEEELESRERAWRER